MQYQDYYEVLAVDKDASTAEIQKAYRSLARKYHPDINQDPEAESHFKKINEAYEALGDPEKRRKYDQYGSAWRRVQDTGSAPSGWEGMRFDFGGPTSHFDSGETGFSSFFEMLFGDQLGGRDLRASGPQWRRTSSSRRQTAGQDRESRLEVSFEELARGGSKRIELIDPLTGSRKSLVVTLPPGILPGKKIRLSGKGHPGAGGARGDLYLTVELRPDSRFRLEGRDLYTELPVSPWEAALGSEATVPTLNGGVAIKLPPSSSTGRKIRLRGRGLPNPGGEPGDLLVEIRVVVPERLTEEERKLFEQLGEVSTFEPRAAP